MKFTPILAAVAFAFAAPAVAQDAAPDGSSAFGFEPYIGVLGGVHAFDGSSDFGGGNIGDRLYGPLVSGIAGFNIPLGPLFAGVEGNVAKGFTSIDWEYGVAGRLGFRAGETGLIYASAGYQWVNGKASRGFDDRHDMMYGIGVEVGPREIGLGGVTGESGVRLRLQVDTYNFDSIRPMAGLVLHF